MSFIFSGIRKEMRERTDELLSAQDKMIKALNKNTRIWEKVLGANLSNELKDELKSSMLQLVKAEEELNNQVCEHIKLLKKIIEQIG